MPKIPETKLVNVQTIDGETRGAWPVTMISPFNGSFVYSGMTYLCVPQPGSPVTMIITSELEIPGWRLPVKAPLENNANNT